jgi:hypothetical protein
MNKNRGTLSPALNLVLSVLIVFVLLLVLLPNEILAQNIQSRLSHSSTA